MMKHYYYIINTKYAHIYDMTIDELLKHNPPCKGCLIQPMCMYVTKCMPNNNVHSKIIVKVCKKLDEFMKGKNYFEKL